MITISYTNVDTPVVERRLDLKTLFYFDCCCSRCLLEITELELKASSSLQQDIFIADTINNNSIENYIIANCEKEPDLLVQELCDSLPNVIVDGKKTEKVV